jgi:hypothetical protein
MTSARDAHYVFTVKDNQPTLHADIGPIFAGRGRPDFREPAFDRGHWTVENGCHDTLDWNRDADRCTIRTGHGPENLTALRRCAIGAIKAKSRDTVAATIQRLARNVRLMFDYLRMTDNSRCRQPSLQVQAG